MTETLEAPVPSVSDRKLAGLVKARAAAALKRASKKEHEAMAETFSSIKIDPNASIVWTPKETRDNPWPKLKDCGRFFGRIEFGPDGMITSRWTRRIETYVRLPFVMRAAWNPELVVSRIACHRAVARSLDDIFRAIQEKGAHEGLIFGGSMRFDTLDLELSPSCWGAAVTFDPTCSPTAKVMEEFFARGWNLDGSTFYAAQL